MIFVFQLDYFYALAGKLTNFVSDLHFVPVFGYAVVSEQV